MLFGHDEGKNIKQLCNGEDEVICPEMGGTGENNLRSAGINIINSLAEGTSIPIDNDYFIAQYTGGGEVNKTFLRKRFSCLWGWLKKKLKDVKNEVIVWANANPDSNFSNQKIALNLTEYEEVEIRFILDKNGRRMGSVVVEINEPGIYNITNYRRWFSCDTTGVTFTDCDTPAGAIPLKIIARKGVE